MESNDWWRTYFDEHYLDFHRDRPYRDTEEEIHLLEKVLGPARGRRLLDACCGHGRHAYAMAERGWRVTGVDQSAVMLDLARAAESVEGIPTPEWVRADLTFPFAVSGFDAALCLFTSFGYCSEDDRNLSLLENIQRALKPDGLFVLDVANRDFLVQHPYAIRNWWRRGEEFILEETTLSPVTSIATTRNVLVSREGVRESEYRIRLYSLHEVVRMMVEAGFEITSAFGNFPEVPISPTSPRIILVSKKES